MSHEIFGSGVKISEEDINKVERGLGISFPKSYRDFLLKFNGGRPRQKCFSIDDSGRKRLGQVLDFFGIYDPIVSCNIDWNYHVFSNRIPSGFLPIACEDGGNLICLYNSSTNSDAVYYWDHEQETTPPSFKSVYKVSDSFEKFMSGLF